MPPLDSAELTQTLDIIGRQFWEGEEILVGFFLYDGSLDSQELCPGDAECAVSVQQNSEYMELTRSTYAAILSGGEIGDGFIGTAGLIRVIYDGLRQ